MFLAAQDGGQRLTAGYSIRAIHSQQTLQENLASGAGWLRILRYHETVPSFFVQNFGCRATQADGAAIEHQFRERGLEPASSETSAGLVVLNTCTVTASADRDARAAIRRIRRENPNCEIVVTGCYAQRAPEEVASIPGVSRVIGNSHKQNLAEIALRPNPAASFVPLADLRTDIREPDTGVAQPKAELFVSDIFAHTELLAAPVFEGGEFMTGARTRPNLKIQDGCNNRCSFCVIPSVRGQSRSLSLDRILQEVNALVTAGYREVVISGINLGRWGRDLPVRGGHSCPPTFEALVRAILSETHLEKLRLSSIEPMDWSDELISLMSGSPRIAKHAHVPLQSGSDRILRLMHRKYRPWHYREKIEKLRAVMPHAAIGADVMVGFPGETEADFEQTLCLIQDLPFTYLHVFTYSSRPGTPSAAMPHQVPVHIARERNRILRRLADEKKQAFMRSFVGQNIQAITLSANLGSSPFTEALTENYLKLHLQGRHDPNCWMMARIEQVENGMLVGSLS